MPVPVGIRIGAPYLLTRSWFMILTTPCKLGIEVHCVKVATKGRHAWYVTENPHYTLRHAVESLGMHAGPTQSHMRIPSILGFPPAGAPTN